MDRKKLLLLCLAAALASPSLVVGLWYAVRAGREAFADGKPPCRFDRALHYTERAAGERKVNYIVVHTIEGSAKSAIAWFKSEQSKVSAHYVISFDGEIVQMVEDKDEAWHAGTRLHNAEGIGIEHEGYAAKDAWTPRQMKASAALARWLCKQYGIPVDRTHILGHSEIAPGRKNDPGPHFDWDLYLKLIKEGDKEGALRPPAPGAVPRGGGPPSEDPKKVFFVAERLDAGGEWVKARRLFQLLYQRYEGTEECERARAFLDRYETDPAIRAAIERAEADEEVRAWLGLAESYRANDRPDRALALLRRLAACYPVHPDAPRARALAKEIEAEGGAGADGE